MPLKNANMKNQTKTHTAANLARMLCLLLCTAVSAGAAAPKPKIELDWDFKKELIKRCMAFSDMTTDVDIIVAGEQNGRNYLIYQNSKSDPGWGKPGKKPTKTFNGAVKFVGAPGCWQSSPTTAAP